MFDQATWYSPQDIYPDKTTAALIAAGYIQDPDNVDEVVNGGPYRTVYHIMR